MTTNRSSALARFAPPHCSLLGLLVVVACADGSHDEAKSKPRKPHQGKRDAIMLANLSWLL